MSEANRGIAVALGPERKRVRGGLLISEAASGKQSSLQTVIV